jgi:hypothetical protein
MILSLGNFKIVNIEFTNGECFYIRYYIKFPK